MIEQKRYAELRQPWMKPEFNELDVRSTAVFPSRGADVGGNPEIDCQRS